MGDFEAPAIINQVMGEFKPHFSKVQYKLLLLKLYSTYTIDNHNGILGVSDVTGKKKKNAGRGEQNFPDRFFDHAQVTGEQ